jgi:hypothetical protein
MENLDIQARVRCYYDIDTMSYIFVSTWNNNHSIKRTVTKDQAYKIKDMIMGAHIEVIQRCTSDPNTCNHPYCEFPRCTEPTLR